MNIINLYTSFLINRSFIYGFLLVYFESFFPFLPLSLFITINTNIYGFFWGSLISWIGTCIGSISVYFCFYFWRKEKYKIFYNLSFIELVILFTLPFTPTFLLNSYCGICGISFEKYLLAIIIGKAFIVIFWAYIGRGFISGFEDYSSFLFIGIALLIAYFISKNINKKISF